MNAYGTRRHLYDPKSHILPPMDHSTISLQMGTNKGASQVSTTSHDIAHFLFITISFWSVLLSLTKTIKFFGFLK